MSARYRPEWSTALVAAVLGGVYLLLPPMGSDLAAQTARAGFFADYGYTPVDLRWYAGVDQLGYSLISQPVMSLLGVRLTGVVAVVLGSVLLTILLRRTHARRLWLGSMAGAVCVMSNLVSGRVTYGLGVTFALGALVALTYRRGRPVAAVAALLAAATSPVAGLFVGLAGVALAVSPYLRRVETPAAGRILVAARRFLTGFDHPQPTSDASNLSQGPGTGSESDGGSLSEPVHATAGEGNAWRDGLTIAIPAALPVIASGLFFGDGGWMNISHSDTNRAITSGLLIALLIPRRAVRVGALLSAFGVLAAALIHTPVGLNATRLPVMFTLPLIAAYPAIKGLSRLIPLLVVSCLVQPPINVADVYDIGNPSAHRSYFTPLAGRLAQEHLTGRVEIPSTRDYWEAAYLGDVPLARGWLRQADIDRNPLFFTTIPGGTGTGVPLNAATYRAWLTEQAVQFVAVPDADLTWSGKPEAELIRNGLPYLTPVWQSEHWRLYAVSDPAPIVAAPATLVSQSGAAITIQAPAAGDVAVRVRYHRWLHGTGGATVRADGVWTILHVPAAGTFTLTS